MFVSFPYANTAKIKPLIKEKGFTDIGTVKEIGEILAL